MASRLKRLEKVTRLMTHQTQMGPCRLSLFSIHERACSASKGFRESLACAAGSLATSIGRMLLQEVLQRGEKVLRQRVIVAGAGDGQEVLGLVGGLEEALAVRVRDQLVTRAVGDEQRAPARCDLAHAVE